MARVEAPVYQEEKKSKWPARLTWGGLVVAVLGVVTAAGEVAAAGVVIFGGGLALWKGKKKG